jgi:predicted phosphodiesterase
MYKKITEFLSTEKFRQQTLAEQIVELITPSMKCLDYIDPKRAMTAPQPRYRSKPLEQEAVLLISDTHAGKLTPDYNISVFKERIENIVKNALEVILLEKKSYKIDVLNVFMLGDLVDGSRIYKNQQFHQDKNAFDQVVIATGVFEEMVLGLLPYFKKVKLWCVKGNHGRVAFEEHEKVNYDMFLYAMMRERFKEYVKHGNLEMTIAEDEDYNLAVNITGTSFLLSHGEETKSHLAIPYYGLERDAASLNALYRNTFDILCIGHFHTNAILSWQDKKMMICGTTVTQDLFGKKVVKRLPGNKFYLFGINPKHSGELTFLYEINSLRRSYDKVTSEGK